MFDIPPDPIAFSIGPINIGWYGLCYAIGLAAAYLLLVWLARRAGEDPDIVGNGIIIVAIAALIGGRLYHVIDQWHLYANDPMKIILPPYSGLGVYGGIITGTLAAWWYARRRGVSFARWADIVAPTPTHRIPAETAAMTPKWVSSNDSASEPGRPSRSSAIR